MIWVEHLVYLLTGEGNKVMTDEQTPDDVDGRLDRSTFLYLDPKPPENEFAQCNTCRDWIVDDRCYIHRPTDEVPGSASCGLYVNGEPIGDVSIVPLGVVTPIESGLVDRDVRCENCKWFDYHENAICMFFDMLNRQLPEVFNLDIYVDAKGCCNAQQSGS